MGMVFMYGKMDRHIKDNGRMGASTVEDCGKAVKETITMVSGNVERLMVREPMSGYLEISIQVSGRSV